MKKIRSWALVALMVLLSASTLKSNDISLDWGKAISALKGNFVPNGETIYGCDGYVNLEEDYNFLGITAHSITYGFCNNKLTSVKVGMFNKDLTDIVGYLTSNYDKPEIAMNNGIVTYKWTSSSMMAVLLYDKNNGKGVDLSMKNLNTGSVSSPRVAARSRQSAGSSARQEIRKPEQVPEPEPEPEVVKEPCPVRTLYDGFKCRPWGTPFNEMNGTLTKYTGKSSAKMDDYEMRGDDLMYEGIKTSTTIYSFKNNLFQGATMAMYNKDVNKIVAIWTDDYGKPRVVDGGGFFTNYEWHLDGLLLTITYIHEKEDGIGVLAGIVCENDNFKVNKPFSGKIDVKGSSTDSKSVSEPSESSRSDARSNARDRFRNKTSSKDKATDDEQEIIKQEEPEEVIEEAPENTSETKSKRELMRERKEKN